jgi:hypothetical protein
MKFGHYQLKDGENLKITVDDNPVYCSKVPSLLEVLYGFSQWQGVYDQVPGVIQGLMTENVIDHFHTQAVDATMKLNHAGYSLPQIAMETGLMPAKIEAIFERAGEHLPLKNKAPSSPTDSLSLLPYPLWDTKHSYSCEDSDEVYHLDSWEDFMRPGEWGPSDVDYNYLFRWDWKVYDDPEELEMAGSRHVVVLQYMKQRKGIHVTVKVKVKPEDEPHVRAHLQERWKCVEDVWAPISQGVAGLTVPFAPIETEEKTETKQPDAEELSRYERFKNGGKEEQQRQVIEELGGLHPDQVNWVRHRFYSHHADSRPVRYPPPGPWWCSGSTDDENGEIQIIVAFLPEGYEIKKYWPEVGEVSFSEPYGKIVYSDRFAKPEWWPF